MDQIIDSRFERLEKALATLIDSVTKYHPSTTQAEELKAADQDLSKGLLEVQIHQNNYLRIQQLRQLSASLDAQIRETLISLATTRKDIVSTHTTTYPPGESFPVTYTDLLQYARRISKTTLPPASALAQAPAAATLPSSFGDAAAPASGDAAQAGSVVTPAATLSPIANGQQQQQEQQQQPAASVHTSLPDGMRQYLNPLSGQVFFPWPQEDKIRGGALASNQILAEQGIEVRGFDPAMEEDRRRREEEQRREREEQEKRERDEQERRMREEMERGRRERERQREREQTEWRRASVGTADAAAARAAGEKKKQFQFTSLDDLDDDED